MKPATWIAPRVGLPELPVVEWPENGAVTAYGIHWKTRHLVEWTAGRPFAWVDDEITRADGEWVVARYPVDVLLHRVDPAKGLREDDFAVLRRWRASVTAP